MKYFFRVQIQPQKVTPFDISILKTNQPFQLTSYVQLIGLTEKNPSDVLLVDRIYKLATSVINSKM